MTNSHKVIIFHDETEFQAGDRYKGHVLFLVPESVTLGSYTPMFGNYKLDYSPIRNIRKKVETLRESSHEDRKLHFAELSGRKWYQSDTLTRATIELAVDSLRSKRPKIFTHPLCCKMAVLFFSSHTDLSLYGGEVRKERRLRHHETVLRMLMKGALHYLYTDDDEVTVRGLVSDGDPFHRKLDDSRVIWRINYDEYQGRTPLRQNISFSNDASIEQLDSDHKEYSKDSEDSNKAHLLQISDLLLGSTIRSCHIGCKDYPRMPKPGSIVEDKKGIVAFPVKKMLSKENRGFGFKYSGHNRSFSVSFIEFRDDEISFKPIKPLDIKIENGAIELPFNQ